MDAVDRLRRDHQIIRSKLDALESALQLGTDAWFVLREVCFTLSRQLRDHIRREEELVAACRQATAGGINPKILAEVVVEHKDEPTQLRHINRLFVVEPTQSLERIRPVLGEVIRKLRHHMAEEEAELFPIFERVLAEQAGQEAAAEPTGHLHEGMTVNRVVQKFPPTRRVFEPLFISVPLEGCTCLDEVAWRHGMESRELLSELEGVITSCGCADAPSTTTAEMEPGRVKVCK